MTTLHMPGGWGRSGFALVVPARNEAARLPRLLASCASDPFVRDILVVANGCEDATAEVARKARGPARVAVLCTPALDGGVGEARRLGMAIAAERLPGNGILATTDADCLLGRGWGRTSLRALALADAVCGRILPDPAEFRALPPIVRRHGALEDLLADLRAAGRKPAPHDPGPVHGQSPGASLAFRAWAYAAAGGFDPVRCHEDRLLIGRMERMGLRVARPAALQVYASCRMVGRAPGGMASTIAVRAAEPARLLAEMASFAAEIAGRGHLAPCASAAALP